MRKRPIQQIPAQTFQKLPDIVSANELLPLLGVGRRSFFQMLQNGSITCFKIGKSYKIPKSSLLDYVEKEDENQ